MKTEYLILAMIGGVLTGWVGSGILLLFFQSEIFDGIDRIVIYVHKLFRRGN